MSRTSYLSVTELLSAPTGIDWKSVPVRDATPQQQATAATLLINRASSWITGWCGQPLWATEDVETVGLPSRQARMQDGVLTVFPSGQPIIAVDSVAVSYDGARTFQPLVGTTILNAGPGRQPQMFQYSLGNNALTTRAWYGGGGWLQFSYRNGFANAELTVAANAGDSSLTVDNALGVLPGDRLTIYDGDATESVSVSSTYVASASTLPLTAPLLNSHAVGITVSGMAESLREACLILCANYVRERGSQTVALSSVGTSRAQAGSPITRTDEVTQILASFKRIGV